MVLTVFQYGRFHLRSEFSFIAFHCHLGSKIFSFRHNEKQNFFHTSFHTLGLSVGTNFLLFSLHKFFFPPKEERQKEPQVSNQRFMHLGRDATSNLNVYKSFRCGLLLLRPSILFFIFAHWTWVGRKSLLAWATNHSTNIGWSLNFTDVGD